MEGKHQNRERCTLIGLEKKILTHLAGAGKLVQAYDRAVRSPYIVGALAACLFARC